MRYHSPFMMKSDKSPPSSELSTRSSYQGQSLIKTGTYLHDGDIPLGNSKPNVHMQLRIPLAFTSTSTTRLHDSASANRRYVIRRATGESARPWDGAKKRRWFLSREAARRARLEKRVRAADRRKTGSLPSLKIAFHMVKKFSCPMECSRNLLGFAANAQWSHGRSLRNIKTCHVSSRMLNMATQIYRRFSETRRKLIYCSFRKA